MKAIYICKCMCIFDQVYLDFRFPHSSVLIHILVQSNQLLQVTQTL